MTAALSRARRGFHTRARLGARGLLVTGFLLLGVAPAAWAAGDAAAAPKPAPKKEDPEYRAAITQGDQAYLGKQFAEAETAYRRAVERSPQSAEAFARLACAQRELGKFDEAIETLGRGLQTSSTVTDRAKLVFLQADIRERKRELEKATERWNAYLDLSGGGERTIDLDAPEAETPTTSVPGAKVYPATARERLNQIEAAQKRLEDYGAVKDRIKKREQEGEATARKAK